MPFLDVEDAIAQLDKTIDTAIEMGLLKRRIRDASVELEKHGEGPHGQAIALLQAYDEVEKVFKENSIIMLELREWLNESRLRVEKIKLGG